MNFILNLEQRIEKNHLIRSVADLESDRGDWSLPYKKIEKNCTTFSDMDFFVISIFKF